MSWFEWYLKRQGFDLAAAAPALERTSRLPREELEKHVQDSAWELARFHAGSNPLYRQRTGGVLPRSWEDLPLLAKADFQQPLQSLLTEGFEIGEVYKANTSGSSGHPFTFAKDKFAHACAWALIKQRYAWHDIGLDSLQARFYGIPLERIQYTREKLKDVLMRRVRFPVFDLSDAVLQKFEDRFRGSKFEYVYGYTNSLVMFARFLLRRGVRLNSLCPSLKLCITTSEVCTQEDRDILTGAFGVRVANEYGASEVGVIAFENPRGEWVLSEENLLIEVVDESGRRVKDGTPGYLLVTDLHNRAFPFIRYKIGDVGALSTVGSGPQAKRLLLKLYGRENDTIILPSGRRSPGLTFYYISRSVLESSGVLREFIIRQTGMKDFVFDVVSDRPLTVEEASLIQEKMDLYLEPGLRLTINRVPAIQRPESGKIKHFYSEWTGEG